MNTYSEIFKQLLADYDNRHRSQIQALVGQKDSTIQQLQTTIDELQSKHSELITSLQTAHQRELNALMQEINVLNSYNKQANDTNKRLQVRLDDLMKSENALKTHWQTLSNKQQATIAEQSKEIAKLMSLHDSQSNDIRRLTNSLSELQTIVTHLATELTAIEKTS